ncbi:hypothetical protein Lalb_Chr03g0032121 [Lupinus albus]|uniref:Uncharacterized protein n=1 Tax=Lupinus albus TaxID=3870 RepID=A0A6A4QU61_LUPAL|nr:hypothetical protein Lalb_Chr03g0032121 [Lupinus albus]
MGGSRTRVGVQNDKGAKRGVPSFDSELPISNAGYTDGSTIDYFHVSDFGAFDQSYRIENTVDLSRNSTFTSLSSQSSSPGPVDKLTTSLDKSPLKNKTEPHRSQF